MPSYKLVKKNFLLNPHAVRSQRTPSGLIMPSLHHIHMNRSYTDRSRKTDLYILQNNPSTFSSLTSLLKASEQLAVTSTKTP